MVEEQLEDFFPFDPMDLTVRAAGRIEPVSLYTGVSCCCAVTCFILCPTLLQMSWSYLADLYWTWQECEPPGMGAAQDDAGEQALVGAEAGEPSREAPAGHLVSLALYCDSHSSSC